jgi:hypothetical protein
MIELISLISAVNNAMDERFDNNDAILQGAAFSGLSAATLANTFKSAALAGSAYGAESYSQIATKMAPVLVPLQGIAVAADIAFDLQKMDSAWQKKRPTSI